MSNIQKIFISYSHKDSNWYDQLVTHFKAASNSEDIIPWSDNDIKIGEDWEKRIGIALDEAEAAVFLISADFLNSDFIKKIEVKRLLERKKDEGLLIFPLIVRPCGWENINWLKKMQFKPGNDKALSDLSKNRREHLLVEFTKEIVERLNKRSQTRTERYKVDSQKRDIALLPSSPAALIVIGDIIDFSFLKSKEQVGAVKNLWEFLYKHHLLNRITEAVTNGMEDWALAAFPCNEQNVDYSEVVEFAKDWINYMIDSIPSVSLRIGIHQGACERLKRMIRSREDVLVVGKGPNECRRIVSFGDAQNIIVSENFVQAWANQEKGVYEKFTTNEPITIFIKHEVPINIRIYKQDSELKYPPRKLASLDVVRKRIYQNLELIEQEFVNEIKKYKPKLSRSIISTRVSIFSPTKINDNRYLCSTNYRFHYAHELEHRGNTMYEISDKGTGHVGRAFCSGKIQILYGLPDYNADPAGYVNYLAKTGLNEKVIQNFGRKAKSFIAIPFGIAEDEPEAVICLDMKDPLDKIRFDNLLDIAIKIKNSCIKTLAPYWKLRVHY